MDKFPEKTNRNVQKNVSESYGVEEKKVTIIVSKDRIKLPPNIMVFQTFAYLAAIKLKPSTNRLLMYLFSMSRYENFISMDLKTISEELNISKQSIVSAMNELVNNNIILKVKHLPDKRRNEYFLNPVAAWKGNSFTRLDAIKKTDNQLKLFERAGDCKDGI